MDLAGDGDLDIVYNNYEGPPTLIRNHTCDGHRVMIKLAGRAPNLDAIGAELRIETTSGVQVHQVYTERGVVASEPATVHFGLGNDTAISKLTIHWPNGQVQVLEDLPVDKLLTITQPALAPGRDGPPPAGAPQPAARPLRTVRRERPTPGAWTSRTRTSPSTSSAASASCRRRQGMNGPAIAVADVNGDGLPDVFVSGTDGQSGVLFLGQPDGALQARARSSRGPTREGLRRRRGPLLRRERAAADPTSSSSAAASGTTRATRRSATAST